jgi:hypothetical protein
MNAGRIELGRHCRCRGSKVDDGFGIGGANVRTQLIFDGRTKGEAAHVLTGKIDAAALVDKRVCQSGTLSAGGGGHSGEHENDGEIEYEFDHGRWLLWSIESDALEHPGVMALSDGRDPSVKVRSSEQIVHEGHIRSTRHLKDAGRGFSVRTPHRAEHVAIETTCQDKQARCRVFPVRGVRTMRGGRVRG